MSELEGQMPLFTLDGADEWIQKHFADEGEYEQECTCCYLCIMQGSGRVREDKVRCRDELS